MFVRAAGVLRVDATGACLNVQKYEPVGSTPKAQIRSVDGWVCLRGVGNICVVFRKNNDHKKGTGVPSALENSTGIDRKFDSLSITVEFFHLRIFFRWTFANKLLHIERAP
jgi:hypothetical protein